MTRTFRTTILSLAFIGVFVVTRQALAAAPVTVSFTSSYAGGEVRPGDGFILNVRAGSVALPAQATVTPDATVPSIVLPSRYQAVGSYYSVSVDGAKGEALASNVLWLKVPAPANATTAVVLFAFDPATSAWTIVGTRRDAAGLMIGETRLLHTTLVVASDVATTPGAYGPDVPVNANALVTPITTNQKATFKTTPAWFTLNAMPLVNPATLIITPDQALPAALPARYVQRSGVWYVSLRAADNTAVRMASGLVVQSKLTTQNYFQQVALFYNPARKEWERTSGNRIFASGYVVIADDRGAQVGIASWYRSAKNPDGVANNQYPMGTKLKVTNVENGKTTTVRVVSRGPYVRGRVIDLVYTAFKKIKGTNGGVARVSVAVVDPKVLGESVSVPQMPPATDTSSSAPVVLPVSSTAGIAYDVDKGLVTAGKNVDEAHPIASLSKLMTALVYLDRKPTFKNTVTYQATDKALFCSCLYVSPGETLTTNDLWHAMLIGSANNATRALVRSTKLSEAQFVQLMNDKAKALGLTTLTFADPTGLDPANQGSARDVAKLAAVAFARPEIANAATKITYSFSTLNTKTLHTVKGGDSRKKMLTSGWQVSGIKTGYIEESGNNLITQVKGKTTGRTMVTVILGAANLVKQYEDTEKALSIGFANLQ